MAEDNGREFEDRALALARAIFDPTGIQGAEMVDGRERDAIFVNETSVVAFEFTQMATKQKAEKDGKKLAELILKLDRDQVHRFKSKLGYFVTEQEPTAEQRGAIDKIARDRQVPLKTMSISSLRGMLVDAEGYLSRRLEAPFGSTGFKFDGVSLGISEANYVEPVIATVGAPDQTVNELADEVLSGGRIVVTGDFGAGKSALLEQVFLRLRKRFFRDKASGRLPIHINLRDCDGLRTASEVLRRHVEEVGLPGTAGLLPAWRSGNTVLLLDGFDEIIPTRWVGSVRDLQQVRWRALEAVRRLVEESPDGTGVLIVGRAQYFADDDELLRALGIGSGQRVSQLVDFDAERSAKLLGSGDAAIPAWLPSRPLLLRYLAVSGVLDRIATSSEDDEAAAWVELIDLLAKREADRISSVDPARVRDLLSRIATLTRGADGAGQVGQGLVSMEDMEQAFREVCGYEPEEEGKQLLLRLPGLARAADSSGREMRSFVDGVLAHAAYGLDLSAYIASPYSEHPLSAASNWTALSSDLPPRVAAVALARQSFPTAHVRQAINARLEHNKSDAVMLDLFAVAEINAVESNSGDAAYFRELLIANLSVTPGSGFLARSRFQDCLVEVLDLESVDHAEQLPTLDRCVVDMVEGVASLPPDWAEHFLDCELVHFSAPTETTAGLMALERPLADRIALTILKKVYAQAGSGRKEAALSRGLPLDARGEVPLVIERLVSAGLVAVVGRRAESLVLPAKGRRAQVLRIIDNPSSFGLDELNGR